MIRPDQSRAPVLGAPPAVAIPATRGGSGHRLRSLLGVPLFQKLLLSHLGTVALAVAAGLSAGWVLGGRGPASVGPALALLAVLTVLVGAAVSAGLMRLALSPLERLEAAALEVAGGNLDIRVEASRLADRKMDSLTRTFNHMMDSVRAARARERALSTRVLAAEEHDRDRLARELYGGVAQTVAGVMVRLQLADRRGELDSGFVAEARSELGRALEEVRSVARQLRPPELDELGVLQALQAHARRLGEGRVVQVIFQGSIPERHLSPATRLALFRIAEESLSNALCHSGASAVSVEFQPGDSGLEVRVADNGAGFDVEAAMRAPDGNIGLLGMRERALHAAGTLRLESAPGLGTVVRVLLPWANGGAPAPGCARVASPTPLP